MSTPPPGIPARWKKTSARLVARTRIFDLMSVGFHHPAHSAPREFTLLDVPDWVNIIALTPAHELVLVRQFRFGIDDLSWEIPGGVIERGEDPLAAGLRELQEETGFAGGQARLLARVHPNPPVQGNHCHFVFAQGVTRSAMTAWDENEEIEVVARPVDEVYADARSGRITHALVLSALFLFEPYWAEIRAGRPV